MTTRGVKTNELENTKINEVMNDDINKDYIKFLKEEINFLQAELKHKNEIISYLLPRSIKENKIETRSISPDKENIATSRKSSEDANKVKNVKADGNQPSKHENNRKVTKDYPKIEVIGDSLLNGIEESKLSSKGNIKVRNYPGATTEDLKDHANPTIRKKVDLIIIHAGTNDITKKSDTIPNLQAIVNNIKRKSANTKIAISSLITRKDSRKNENGVLKLNNELKAFCDDNLLSFINNDNIDESCLGVKKLHLAKQKRKCLFCKKYYKLYEISILR